MPTAYTFNTNKNYSIAFKDEEHLLAIFEDLCEKGWATWEGVRIHHVEPSLRKDGTFDAWVWPESGDELDYHPWVAQINEYEYVGHLVPDARYFSAAVMARESYEVVSQKGDLVHFRSRNNIFDVLQTNEFETVIIVKDLFAEQYPSHQSTPYETP